MARTSLLLNAIRNRHVDIIGHPTGRLLPDREGADLDLETILKAAAEHGVALEVNANPQRLDLDDVHIKRALELGCLLAINTDAHHPDHFSLAHYGVGTARRGWAAAENVINAWPVERLLQWLDERGHRRPRHVPRVAAEEGASPAAEKAAAPAGPKPDKKPAAKPPAAAPAAKLPAAVPVAKPSAAAPAAKPPAVKTPAGKTSPAPKPNPKKPAAAAKKPVAVRKPTRRP